ncbi:MAG: hypothetical protein IPK26_02880 [Planctomycetes bacterium]|nr:hypothetical protein [Planctomycetota bacterium]
MSAPPVPGQSVRFDLSYPASAHYNLYSLMVATPPMSGSLPFSLAGFTVLGQPSIDPATAISTFAGQIQPGQSVSHTMTVPANPALAGLAIDVQSIDGSIPSRTIAFSDNELVMAVQAQRWQTPTVLSSTAGAEPPRLARRAQGDGVMVWIENASGDVATSRYSPTTGWSPVVTIDASAAASSLDVGIDAAGNAICVWLDNTDDSVRASRQAAGGAWSAPALLETGAGEAGHPKLAVDAAGNAIATWWQYDGAFNTGVVSVFAARYVAGQGWGTAVAIENDNQSWGEPPNIAGDAAGNATVVWRWGYQQGGNWYSTVMSNRYSVGSGWGLAQVVTTGSNISGNLPPVVGVDAGGNAVAAWEAYAPGNSLRELHVARWTGGTWGTTVRLDPTTASSSHDPKVLMTGNGEAIVSWWELDGVGKVMTSTLQGGTWSAAAAAAAPYGTWARSALLAKDGTGRITLTYSHGAPGGYPSCFCTQWLPGVGWLTPYRIDDNNHNGVSGASGLHADASSNVLAVMGEQWFSGNYKIVATEFR